MSLFFRFPYFFVVLLFIQSCDHFDSGKNSTPSPPKIIAKPSRTVQEAGGKVSFTISVSAESGLAVVKQGSIEIKSYTAQSNTKTDVIAYEYTIPANQAYGTLRVYFSVTDQQGTLTTSTTDLNVTAKTTASGWTVEDLGTPLGDPLVGSITIHPQNDNLWFVTSSNGLYVTSDSGQNWTRVLNGLCSALEIDPNNPNNIYAGINNVIHLSTDGGQNWSPKYTFPMGIESLLVSSKDNSVYVGINWQSSEMENGIYKSTDNGDTWQYYSYGVDVKGLIPWDIEEDVLNNKLYVSTEIFDHPTPYHPPFLRSSDGGETWEDIRGIMTWHVVKIQVHPVTHTLYALEEGPGMFYSTDFGDNWIYMAAPFAEDFLIDKKNPSRFFGGQLNYQNFTGGVYVSDNEGASYKMAELEGYTCGGLCLDKESTFLYVACYGHGIFRIKK